MYKNLKKISFALPSIDQFSSRKEWVEACWQKILKSNDLLELMVTPNECRNIVMRAAIMDSLSSGKGIRQIAKELHISSQTIGALKKSLNENKYRSYRERGKTERKKKIYSPNKNRKQTKDYRRYFRTKYGKVYIP